MISYNSRGDLIITGSLLSIHQLWDHFDKYELVQDMIEGKIWGYYWKENTTKDQKVADFLKGSTAISGNVVKDYFKLKEFEKKSIKNDKILEEIAKLNSTISGLSEIIRDLYKTNIEIKKALKADAFVGLKEISESFMIKGKPLYSVGSLRNKIKSETFGETTVGYLDIDNFHITLLKRGKTWITPLAHWENERKKINYDFLKKLRYKNKNVYDKKFPRKKSFSGIVIKDNERKNVELTM